MDYATLANLYGPNMYGGLSKVRKPRKPKAYDPDAYDKQYGAGRPEMKAWKDPDAYDKQFGAGLPKMKGKKVKAYDPDAYDKQYGAGIHQFGAGLELEEYEQLAEQLREQKDQFGGADYSEAECRQWLADNFTNPKTGRKIGPTKSGSGVYYDLQRSCLGYASTASASTSSSSTVPSTVSVSRTTSVYKMQTPKPVVAHSPRLTNAGEEIVRTTAGRKGPSVSATSLPVGTQRMGNDNQMYIVKLRANSTQYWQPCSQSTANC